MISTENLYNPTFDECQKLSIDGEQAIRSNDTFRGIQMLERALLIGTDDEKQLCALFSQLGNAYFALRDYNQAKLYHMSDLNASRSLKDDNEIHQAKAYSNLSATYTMLQEFDNAIICANNVIQLGLKLRDKSLECRGYYNLGLANLQFAINQTDDNNDHKEDTLTQAIEAFQKHLFIAENHHDLVFCGLGYGNIGCAYFYKKDYQRSIDFQQKRLLIAKKLGDNTSEQRAISNIAKAQILLKEHNSTKENDSISSVQTKLEAITPEKEKSLMDVNSLREKFKDVTSSTPIHNNTNSTVFDGGFGSLRNSASSKFVCDAGTSPFDDSILQRTYTSMCDLQKINEFRHSDHMRNYNKKKDGDFFDMIGRLNSDTKRMEDQRAELRLPIQNTVNLDLNETNSSNNNRQRLTLSFSNKKLMRSTMKSMTNLKTKVGRKIKGKELKFKNECDDTTESIAITSETNVDNNIK